MADFTTDLQSLRPSFPFPDIDPNMELINQIPAGLNPNLLDNSLLNLHSLIPFSNDSFLSPPEPEFLGNLEQNFPGLVHHVSHNAVPIFPPDSVPAENEIYETKKRRSMDMLETSSANSTPTVSEAGRRMKNNSGRGKRVKSNVTEEEKPKEVVHVRARRGQATDSHSLAERVRRGKINEKFRCLQNIVPGCYKTMGMAVMLDEIINYVQSLQQQVEFLSMKLTTASTFYDFNSETGALETMQRARASEAKDLAKYVNEFQSNWSL